MEELGFGEYYYSELLKAYNSESATPFMKLAGFRYLFKDIFRNLTENETQLFSSVFARIVYVLDKYNTPPDLASGARQFRHYSFRLARNPDLKCTDYDVQSAFHILCRLVEFFYQTPPPNEVFDVLANTKYYDFSAKKVRLDTDVLPFIRAVVKKKGFKNTGTREDKSFAEIICETEEYGEIGLVVSGIWLDTWKVCWKGSVLNLFDIKRIDGNDILLKTTNNSLIVLEPDYLMDVTDLAECFQNHKANIYLYFLKKFSRKGTSLSMLLGNIVNTCFDELIYDKDIDFETAYDNALKIKPLQIFSVAVKEPEMTKLLKSRAASHFETLKKILPTLNSDMISVEPSFISPKFGLQGRLDVLIEFAEEANRKNIVELKSGSAPDANLSLFDANGEMYQIGLWSNHLAQTTCYNLLLDSAFDNRTGSSQILYSSASDYPLRNAPNIVRKKQEALSQRNWIIALERALSQKYYSVLGTLNPSKFGPRPPFVEPELIEFAEAYSMAGELERKYFHEFVTFITREHTAAKIGAGNARSGNGFASLWKDTIPEKEKSLSILSGLTISPEESDFTSLHLVFDRDMSNPSITSLRKGDIAILYRCREDEHYAPLSQQVLKCSIKEISPEKVKVSLRNKLFREDFFIGEGKWVLEPDFIESTNKCLYQSVYRFLCADQEKKDLVLGLKKPGKRAFPSIDTGKLNVRQSELLKKALASENYFLLQGPPGTGKTSYMLQAIVKNLYEQTGENILILAYTNRAVDEICTSLKRISNDFPFLRLGSKESSVHTDRLISCLVDEIGIRELFKRIRNTRIIVSTVSSVLSNPEIMEIKSFDTAVIDEASQILEPQIVGILADVSRYIMIGDEKQLPAIVLQSEANTKVTDEDLNAIQLLDLGTSLFERLLRICMANGWTDAYGMLKEQARMHADIQKLANSMFYNNELDIFPDNKWQTSGESIFDPESVNSIERILSSSRLVFIESPGEDNSKFHCGEAKITSDIIRLIYDKYGLAFDENTVGVISPFRVQCAEILGSLPRELRTLVTVDTVERFQGSERDIIIISFAANHPFNLSSLQSLTDINGTTIDRKLNVALTRARRHLIMLGNPGILSRSIVYRKLLEKIKEDGAYISLEPETAIDSCLYPISGTH